MGNFFAHDPERPGRKARRAAAAFLLFVFGFALASAAFLSDAKPVRAQAAVTDTVTEVQTTVVNVFDQIKDAFVEAAVTAVVNGVNYFGTQVAYSLAVALTSDCPGQIVCWDSKAFEEGFTQAWQGAIGEAIGTLSDQGGFSKLGFDLCNPGVNFSLKIQLGALDEIKPKAPKCDFNAITSNWESFGESLSSGEVLKGLIPTFEKGESPLSVSLGAMDGLYSVKEEAKREEVMKRIMDAAAGGGFSDVRDPVSGRAKAPSSVTHEEFKSMRKKQAEDPENFSATEAAGQIASKAVISVVINVIQTFAMTLISRLLNKLVNGLMSTEELIALQPDLIFNPEGLLNPPGTTGVTEAMATRFSAFKPRDAGVIDPLLDFSVCPTANRTPNNCVIDQQWANAIRVADVTPVTIRQALEKNMLHGDWTLIPSSNQVKDQDPYCYTYAYCESNLKKLRAARIISVGWEIAAQKAGPTTTLREIVDGFHDCNGAGEPDATHRWCHLIDPDWVLKIPPTQCRALAYGATPLSNQIPTRVQQCVDTQTCLKQDDSGVCIGGWGYCARERNVWRFNGDQCPASYNTCRTLKSRTGTVKNYILNTIDHGVCNADNAGCRQYGLNLSTVSCSLGSDCTHPTDDLDPQKSCDCTVNRATCNIARNNTSCTAPNGIVCRQPYPCNSASCACTASLTCQVEKGQRSCTSLTGGEPDGDDWQIDPSLFLNKNVQTCSATNNGCSSLVQLLPGTSLNLVKNGSFEEIEDGDNSGSPDHAKFWTPFGEVPVSSRGFLSRDASKSVAGSNAILLPVINAFSPPASFTCTLTPSAAPDIDAAGVCTADLGCRCLQSAGLTNGYSCLVIKGKSVCTTTSSVIQDGLPVKKNGTFTVSASFIPDAGGSAVHSGITLSFRDATGASVSLASGDLVSTIAVTGGTASTSSCAVSGGKLVFGVDGTKDADSRGLRTSCTFVIANKDVAHASLSLYSTSGDLYGDAVQFEQGGGTSFHDAYGGAANRANLKVPPDFLGCTGDETDRAECGSFAGVCRETEVGCDGYTPSSGDPMIPGIAGPQDVCPAQCSGYDVFKQEATVFDTAKFPVYFIPSTAASCTELDVGCSEFTDVATEQVGYYSQLRLCTKPDDLSNQVYYSWEGSDTTGYQLRVWNFKATMAGGVKAPVVNSAVGTTCCSGGVCGACGAGDVAAGKGTDVCAEAACVDAGPAPCTSLDDATAVDCDSRAIGNALGSTEGLCSRFDIDRGDFDCREFYDASGNRHYRRLPQTIISSAACTQYRITVSTEEDCSNSNGRWVPERAQCVYFADTAESRSCSKAQNNCRAYKGNASTNVRSLFLDDFETGLTNWLDSDDSAALADGIQPLSQSGEAVIVGGHSMKIGTFGGRSAHREVGGLVAPGRSYTLTFWARGTGTLNVGFKDGLANTSCDLVQACPDDAMEGCTCTTSTGLQCNVPAEETSCTVYYATGAAPAGKCNGGTNDGTACTAGAASTCTGGGTCTIRTATPAKPRSLNFSDDDEAGAPPLSSAPKITLSSEWKQYSLGPVIVEPLTDAALTPWGRASVKLEFEVVGPSDVFIDNVNLKEVQDSIFVVRDSWVTPAACDQTPDGIPSPQEMLGCKEYTAQSLGQKTYLRSFTRLCRDKAIGCGAYSDTQNTPDNVYEESFNAVCRLYETAGDGSFTTTPRKCGFARCSRDAACELDGGCPCAGADIGVAGNCVISKGGTSCDIPVPADSGAACVCDYNLKHPAALAAAPTLLGDVCRVAIGETDCRFKLDRWDESTRPDEHPDRVNVSADKRLYLVANRSNQCNADQVGCRAVGRPHYGFDSECTLPTTVGSTVRNGTCADPAGCLCGPINGATCSVTEGEKTCKVSFELGVIDKWDAIAIKDDPSKYEQTLCSMKTLNCEAYTASDGTYYFRDPVDKVCEFKDNVTVNGQTVSGFFRKSASGANFPCYPELLKNGELYAMYKNADRTCTLSPDPNPPNVRPDVDTEGRCTSNSGCQCTIGVDPIPACRVSKGNTTCGYQGWVGVCEAKYDRCEEFVDAAATSAANTEGQPYYYIVNAKLDLKTCAGKASLKQGCVLFKQTSKTENIYSASATYYRSLHEANSGLVSPINCDTDPRNSMCEQRCVSIPTGICSGSDKTCVQDTEDPQKGCPGVSNICRGKKQWGTGCNFANGNRDCSAAEGEVCAAVRHCSTTTSRFCDSDSDCPATETCDLPTGATTAQTKIEKADARVTKNDTNVIIKVRPDRECAQWLACRSFEQVFDAQENKFKPRCTAFTLCDGVTGLTANSLECASVVEPERKVFTGLDYAKRDVTYGGLEYSGYSIPERYPAQYLSPVGITGGRCYTIGAATEPVEPYTACTRSEDCDAVPPFEQYCKQLPGACKLDPLTQGRSCQPGAAVTAEHPNECGNGYCSESYFDTYRFGILLDSTYSCSTDADCDGYGDGDAGAGLDSLGRDANSSPSACSDADITAALSATTAIGVASGSRDCTRTKFLDDGTCVQHRCYYNYDGGAFVKQNDAQRASCRAYPEEDAPYMETIIPDEQRDLAGLINGYDTNTWLPTPRKPGFGGVNGCMYRNNCECSYKRLGFGSSTSRFVSERGGVFPRSIAADGSVLDPAIPVKVSEIPVNIKGICNGGPREGWTCSSSSDCGIDTDGDGINDEVGQCQKLTKITVAQGWPGFCIDRDRSQNINGDPKQYNCNLWLPVDQLAGAPDSFNQYREAGFSSTMANLNYCAVAQGTRTSDESKYYRIILENPDSVTSPCKTASACNGLSRAQCQGSTVTNDVGNLWTDVLDPGGSNGCWWKPSCYGGDGCDNTNGEPGSCQDRVRFNMGDEYRSSYPASSVDADGDRPFGCGGALIGCDAAVWDGLGACEKIGIIKGDTICTVLVAAAAGAGPFYLIGAAVAGALCWEAAKSWCDEMTTCEKVDQNGPFFETPWTSDSQANYVELEGFNHKRSETIAAVFEFTSSRDDEGRSTKLILHEGNGWESGIEFEGGEDVALPGNSGTKGSAWQPTGRPNGCHDMLEAYENGTDIEGFCDSTPGIGDQVCARIEWSGSSPGSEMTLARMIYCKDTGVFGGSDRQRARLVVLNRDACTEVVNAYSDDIVSGPTNFAWTDRLYKASLAAGAVKPPGFTPFDYTVTTKRDNADPQDLEPFGPVTPSLTDSLIQGLDWPIPPYPSVSQSWGSPFIGVRMGAGGSEQPPCGPGEDVGNPGADGQIYTTYCSNGYTTVAGDPSLPAEPPSSAFTAAGIPYACTGDCAGQNPDRGGSAFATARGILSEIFVAVFGRYTYTHGSSGTGSYSSSGDNAWDRREDFVQRSNSPHMTPPFTGPDDSQCDPATAGLCPEATYIEATNGSFEVSGVGAIPKSDSAQTVDAVGGRATAYFKYYAWADSDHMPLRRKIVDFGDGTDPFVSNGMYKNHRGCHAAPDACNTGEDYCGTTAGNDFGLSDQACESRYFQEAHTYTCTPDDVQTLPLCGVGAAEDYPCSDRTACYFKPRIQLMDNWGVCNGTCPGGAGGSGVCLEKELDLNLTNPTTADQVGAISGRNECVMLGTDTPYQIDVGGGEIIRPWTLGPTIRITP